MGSDKLGALHEHGRPRLPETSELFDRSLDAMHLAVEPGRDAIREHAERAGNPARALLISCERRAVARSRASPALSAMF